MTRNEYRKEWREQMKAKGLCTNCGCRPSYNSFNFCEPCYIKQKECREKLRESRKISKTCRECGEPAVSEIFCETHKNLLSQSQVRMFEKGYFSKRSWNLFKQVLEMYGTSCKCCQESNPAFLTVDHINNDGHIERKTNFRSNSYSKLLKQKRTDIQILCWNCNCAKQRIGTCPHQL